jgi:hypothetical protein
MSVRNFRAAVRLLQERLRPWRELTIASELSCAAGRTPVIRDSRPTWNRDAITGFAAFVLLAHL